MKNKRFPCLLCGAALAAFAALASAQAKSHDALAIARAKAEHENQRVLLLLTGGKPETDAALTKVLSRQLGRLLKYEYQLAAMPATSTAGKALRQRFDLGDLELPTLVALDRKESALGRLGMSQDNLSADAVKGFLEQHACTPLDARKVLAAGLDRAKKTKRHLFVYLSAPW